MNSVCRLNNWSKECEDTLNKQINLEYWASIQYHILATYFDKDNVALKNIYLFFIKNSDEEKDHANKFMIYQNKRGGNIKLAAISDIENDTIKFDSPKSNILQAFEKALEMEQIVYKSLLNLHEVADSNNDPQFCDFIEGNYLEEQINAINELAKYITQLKMIGNDGHGLWNFNNEFEVN
tara:strand:+ start:1188 stop:1727 length:540 start_codon:yes stop_codon:yes gene_type:complete